MTIKKYLSGIYYHDGSQMIFNGTPRDASLVAQIPYPDEVEAGARLQIRGWSSIKREFATEQDAANFQDEVGRFIVEAITEKLERI